MLCLLVAVVVSICVELLERGLLLMRITSLFDAMRFSFLIDLRINSILEFINPGKRVSRTVLWRFNPIFIKHSHGCGVQRVLVGFGDTPKQSRRADPCAAPPFNLWQQVLLTTVLILGSCPSHLLNRPRILRIDVALICLLCVNRVPHRILIRPVLVFKYLLVLSL